MKLMNKKLVDLTLGESIKATAVGTVVLTAIAFAPLGIMMGIGWIEERKTKKKKKH